MPEVGMEIAAGESHTQRRSFCTKCGAWLYRKVEHVCNTGEGNEQLDQDQRKNGDSDDLR